MIISAGEWNVTLAHGSGEPLRVTTEQVHVCDLCGDLVNLEEPRRGKASKQECIGNAVLIVRAPHILRLAKQVQSLIRAGRLTGPECWAIERRAAALVDDFDVEES